MKPVALIPGDESIRTQITLTTYLKRRIEQVAKPKGLSLSEYLRQAAVAQLKREQTRSHQLEALAEKIVGSLKTTPHREWGTTPNIIKWQKQLRKQWD